MQQANNLLCNYSDSYLQHNIISIDSICSGVKLGDTLCIQLIDNIAQLLAKPLALMVNVLGTELILINSPINQISELFFDKLHHYIDQQSIPLYSSKITIEKSTLSVSDSESSLIQRALYDGSLLMQLLQG